MNNTADEAQEMMRQLRLRVRIWLARHENLFTLLWYLHLVKNEDPDNEAR